MTLSLMGVAFDTLFSQLVLVTSVRFASAPRSGPGKMAAAVAVENSGLKQRNHNNSILTEGEGALSGPGNRDRGANYFCIVSRVPLMKDVPHILNSWYFKGAIILSNDRVCRLAFCCIGRTLLILVGDAASLPLPLP